MNLQHTEPEDPESLSSGQLRNMYEYLPDYVFNAVSEKLSPEKTD